MNSNAGPGPLRRTALVVLGAIVGVAVTFVARPAGADEAPVALGAADGFAVLGGAGVTSAGQSVVTGDVGACPTLSITGFPPGVVNGTIAAGGAACQAQSDLTIAYDYAAGRPATTTYLGPTELGGTTLTPGVAKSPTSLGITGTLTLDARGDSNAIFIFQAGSTLISAANSNVTLINGAQACNVFWQVGSSATLGAGSTFAGTVLAVASITTGASAAVQGRLFARNAAVTLSSNTIARPVCTPIISGSLSLAQIPVAGTALVEGSAVSLPVTTVADGRTGLVRNWTVTATASDLVSAAGSAISGAHVALEQTGTFTAGAGTVGNEGLVSATADTVDSVYTYTPTAELAPQGNIPAGSYAGTVTQTVL